MPVMGVGVQVPPPTPDHHHVTAGQRTFSRFTVRGLSLYLSHTQTVRSGYPTVSRVGWATVGLCRKHVSSLRSSRRRGPAISAAASSLRHGFGVGSARSCARTDGMRRTRIGWRCRSGPAKSAGPCINRCGFGKGIVVGGAVSGRRSWPVGVLSLGRNAVGQTRSVSRSRVSAVTTGQCPARIRDAVALLTPRTRPVAATPSAAMLRLS